MSKLEPSVASQLEDFRCRIGLHGIIDAAVRQRLFEGLEVFANHVEIDHKAGAFGTSGGEEVEDALRCHMFPLWHPGGSSAQRAAELKLAIVHEGHVARHAMDKGATRMNSTSRRVECTGHGAMTHRVGSPLARSENPLCLPQLWMGKPSALPAMKVCLFSNPGLWTTGRHQKGPHRRCFKMSSIQRVAVESTGAVRSRYRTDFLAISEVRRTPTRHVRLWASAHIGASTVTINGKFDLTANI